MRKLNGITINGEYLGNSVVINGMFRAICTISPVIMRDFVQIINKIERLEEAVKINNFNCGFDCIDIEFKNKSSKGIASLYFKILNGEPELTNCKLIIDGEEYSTLQEKISIKEPIKRTDKPLNSSEEERKQRIRELKERKLEQIRKQREAAKRVSEPSAAQKQKEIELAKLSPQERLKRKRQELIELKKKAMMEKKQGTATGSTGNTMTSPIDKNLPENPIQNRKSEQIETGAGQTEKQNNITPNDDKSANKNTAVENIIENTGNNIEGTATESNVGEISNSQNTLESTSETNTTPNETDIGNKNNGTDENGKTSTTDNEAYNELDENYGEYNSADYQSDTSDNEYNDEYMQDTPRLTLDDFSEEDLENMTEEELAQLEAEFNADLENESNSDYNDYNNYSDYKTTGSGYVDTNFAEKLAEGITLGLTQGLSQGLAQGLSQGLQGLGQGFNSGGNQGFDNNWSSSNQGGFNDNYNSNFNGPSGGQNTNAGFDFADNSNNQQWGQQSQYQTAVPDYNKIDTINNDAAMNARDSYSYDENSNLDDISDLYADFYDENKVEEEVYNEESTNSTQANKNSNTQNTSEIDALKAELEALKAEAETKKDLMTLDEFMAKQKELAEAKESKRRQKLRILGSKERVNASALDGGVFVAGNKVYKWGDTRVLDP